MTIKRATDYFELRSLIKHAVFDWLELREQNIKRLSYVSMGEAKLKYIAQIDFIETVRINIGAIIDRLEADIESEN